MVTICTDVYLSQQLVALISGDTPHEYAGGPTLVELAIDEDKRFGSAGDAEDHVWFEDRWMVASLCDE
jgi:hypothetical protein